jgi:hypothetical protein
MRTVAIAGLSLFAFAFACSPSSSPSGGAGGDARSGSHDGSGGGTSHKEGGRGDAGSGTGSSQGDGGSGSHGDGGSGPHSDGGAGGGHDGGGGPGQDGGGGTHDSGLVGFDAGSFNGPVPTASSFGFTSTAAASCVSDGAPCDAGAPIHSLFLALTSQSAVTCSYVESTEDENVELASTDSLTLIVSQSGTLSPGTFNVSEGGGSGEADYSSSSATCDSTDVPATSGTITLSTLTASQATGSFDLTFGSGQVTGSFTVPICGAFPPVSADAGPEMCVTP